MNLKINIEELNSTLFVMSLCGAILTWMFYLSFTAHIASVSYLVIAIVFTITTPALLFVLWYRKRKE